MKTEVEKGLASHSSNMVVPHDYHREPEDGWTIVTSKKNLRKIRKSKKYDMKNVFDASSIVDSVKSTTSDDSSWTSIALEEVIIQPTETSPPPITNISDDEDLSSIESLFMTSKDEPNQDQPVSQSIDHKNEITPRTGHITLTKSRHCGKYKTTTRPSLITPSS